MKFLNEIPNKIEKLRSLYLQYDDSEDITQNIISIQDWLCKYPKETINHIRNIKLNKYDIDLVKVIENIGPPNANQCAYQLIELIADMNWPVYLNAKAILFKLDESEIINAVQHLIWDEKYREIDAFCFEIINEKPEWVDKIRPFLEEVLENLHQYLKDSHIIDLAKKLDLK